MKKYTDTTSDNIFEDGIGDLIIEDSNASETNRKNSKEISDKYIEVKNQRNSEARLHRSYKFKFEIAIIALVMFVVVTGLCLLFSQIGKIDKGLENCISSGISESRCLKSEGVY